MKMKKNKIKENQIIENLKVIAEHIDKDWDGRFSKCECGAYLIGHPKKCRGCGSSDLTYLEVTLKDNSLPKTLQKCYYMHITGCTLDHCVCQSRVNRNS